MKKTLKTVCHVSLMVFIVVSSVLSGGTWKTYTKEDGLVYNHVYSIAIDTENVKWFGTTEGVSSFDGTTWTTYSAEDGLADNHVSAIAIDADNIK